MVSPKNADHTHLTCLFVYGVPEMNCAPKVGHKVKGYEKERELPKVCPCDEALG
jgi:hypothetical protein